MEGATLLPHHSAANRQGQRTKILRQDEGNNNIVVRPGRSRLISDEGAFSLEIAH
jgi:hypothetical protein